MNNNDAKYVKLHVSTLLRVCADEDDSEELKQSMHMTLTASTTSFVMMNRMRQARIEAEKAKQAIFNAKIADVLANTTERLDASLVYQVMAIVVVKQIPVRLSTTTASAITFINASAEAGDYSQSTAAAAAALILSSAKNIQA